MRNTLKWCLMNSRNLPCNRHRRDDQLALRLMRNHNTNQILGIFFVVLFLSFSGGIYTRAQESTNKIPAQSATTTAGLKSEVIAPGIEHLQLVRGYKSEKEATGPWFINVLRIDLSRARLRLV